MSRKPPDVRQESSDVRRGPSEGRPGGANLDAGPGDARVGSYADLAARILARPARLGRTRLVAVDGPSGAGKSVLAGRLADALAAELGTPPPVVHTDDLLDGWADQFTFWARLDEWVLAPLRAGRAGRHRRYDWGRRRFAGEWVPVPPAEVLILEGVSAARAAIRPELTFAVLVTAPRLLRLRRALVRDGVTLLPALLRWRRGERAYLTADRTAEHVDLVVDGASDLPHDPRVEYVRAGSVTSGPR